MSSLAGKDGSIYQTIQDPWDSNDPSNKVAEVEVEVEEEVVVLVVVVEEKVGVVAAAAAAAENKKEFNPSSHIATHLL